MRDTYIVCINDINHQVAYHDDKHRLKYIEKSTVLIQGKQMIMNNNHNSETGGRHEKIIRQQKHESIKQIEYNGTNLMQPSKLIHRSDLICN